MAIPLVRDLDMQTWQILNAVFQNLSTAPQTPKTGQYYFDTTDHVLKYYNGTAWVSGVEYTFSTGLTNTNGTVTLDEATTSALGGVIVGSNISVSNGTISVANASTSGKGVIEIATDSEASTGISETLAINPKQLATAINGLIKLTDLSIDSGSSNYLGYDNTTGKFSAKVDTTVTSSSSKLVTSDAVYTAIANAIIGGVKYIDEWVATSQTDYSSITLPVKKGYMYYVTGSATIGGIEWSTGDYLLVNEDVASGGTLTNVSKIDNTESSDIVKLNATQTLTNKTINASSNTISNLALSMFASGVVQTSVRAVSSASDSAIATEKAVATGLAGKAVVYAVKNSALTPSSGEATWEITNSIGVAPVNVQVYRISDDTLVLPEIIATASKITIKFNADSNISANTYRCVYIGNANTTVS